LHVWGGAGWILAERDEAFANELINALMFSCGVPEAQRLAIYQALKVAGFKAFEEDGKILAQQ
jgi:hypothetical protein